MRVGRVARATCEFCGLGTAADIHLRWAIPVGVASLLVTILYALKICMIGLRQESRLVNLKRRMVAISARANGGKELSSADSGNASTSAEAIKDDRATTVAFMVANGAFFVGIFSMGAFIISNTP
jgi:hypothetical protein